MIYKELSSQQDKDRFLVLLLSFIMVIIFGEHTSKLEAE
jgi:POT family proton-dependent oligopeptide transporter